MAKDRVTEGDLIDAVNQINKLTGKDYRIRTSGTGKGYNLVQFKNGKGTTVLNAQPARELYNYLNAFFAGIQEGVALESPDLNDPEEALARISRELSRLQLASPEGGEYPEGYHNNVLKAVNAVNAARDYAKGGAV